MSTIILRVLFCCGIIVHTVYAQSTREDISALMSQLGSTLNENRPIKCGTPVVATILHDAHPSGILKAFDRPALHKSRLSPNGFFRIHYDTTSFNTPAMLDTNGQSTPGTMEEYVDSVMAIFESCRLYTLDSLGYDAPPPDGGKGGGSEYDVYIENLGRDFFGVTLWDLSDIISTTPNEKTASYVVIDNDYAEHRTAGINGLRVTAAHEYHHAVQIGSYGIWRNSPNADFYFYEITSTWIEDIIYPSINDYINDLPEYFTRFRDGSGHPLSFTTFDQSGYGYERAIWGHFLTARFGRDVVKEIWIAMRDEPFLQSVDRTLRKWNSEFATEYELFSIWNYFTADRAITNKYYPEGHLYPRWKPNLSNIFSGGTNAVVKSAGRPLSHQLIEIITPSDTVNVLTSHVSIAKAQSGEGKSDVTITLSAGPLSAPHRVLVSGYRLGITVNDLDSWRMQVFSSTSSDVFTRNVYPWPNPIKMSEHQELFLPVPFKVNEVDVTIVSISLDRTFSRKAAVEELFGKLVVRVSSRELRGLIKSGTHFVIMQIGDTQLQWKVSFVQ